MFLLFQNTPSTRHLFARYPSFGKAIIETANGTLKELQAELDLKTTMLECTSCMAGMTSEAESIAQGSDIRLDALKMHCPEVFSSFGKAGFKSLKTRYTVAIGLFLSIVSDALQGSESIVTFNESEPWRDVQTDLLALSASGFWLPSGESETVEGKAAVNCAVVAIQCLKDILFFL